MKLLWGHETSDHLAIYLRVADFWSETPDDGITSDQKFFSTNLAEKLKFNVEYASINTQAKKDQITKKILRSVELQYLQESDKLKDLTFENAFSFFGRRLYFDTIQYLKVS